MGENLIEHVKKIMKCGCDGIKMLEGKPDERKRFPIPDFDSEEFDKLFSYLEKEKINIIWHVNDPEEFWDETKIPEWFNMEIGKLVSNNMMSREKIDIIKLCNLK